MYHNYVGIDIAAATFTAAWQMDSTWHDTCAGRIAHPFGSSAWILNRLPDDPTGIWLETQYRLNERYAQGETIVDLAEAFEISEQHVSQMVRGRRN
jgi:hypothetical protein